MGISFKYNWLFTLVSTVILIFGSACQKGYNNQPNDISNRLVTQREYFQGVLNSTSSLKYDNDKLIYRDFQSDDNHFKHEYYYSDNEVLDYFSRKYDTYWQSVSRASYQYESGLLVYVFYEDYNNKEWVPTEKWSFTYLDGHYDEILMELYVDDSYEPNTKLIYNYSDDYLYDYKVYNYNGDWYLTKEVVFEYIDGVLENIVLYYEGQGSPYGPQEKFSYEYENDLVSRIVLSVYSETEWVQSSEILRKYDISKNMTEERIRPIESNADYYRYEYTYELGNKNIEIYPFYDKALYEYIYPKPSTKKSSKPIEYGDVRLPLKHGFLSQFHQ